jgi:hypothetical protein
MARIKAENYVRLVAQKAWQTWYKLPPQHKNWMDIEDLVEDGVLFMRFYVIPRYRPHRAKFTTYLSTSLENYYKNMLAELFTRKRNECSVVPLATVQFRLRAERMEAEEEIKAVRGLMKVVQQASPTLRRYLNHWLFSHGKIHCRGERFTVARCELLALCRRCGFDREDFEYLLCNDGWQRSLQKVQQNYLLQTERFPDHSL